MAPVVPLAAPPILDAHNTFMRQDSKHPLNGNCTPNNSHKQQLPSQNGDTKQQLMSQSSLQQHHNSEQEGLSRTAVEQVVDERREKDLNDSLFSGIGGTRATFGITTADQELNGRRTVRWSDTHGNDLVQIWEFEPSDLSDSDDDGEDDSQACACFIM